MGSPGHAIVSSQHRLVGFWSLVLSGLGALSSSHFGRSFVNAGIPKLRKLVRKNEYNKAKWGQ